jgi:hypothetical protein
MSVIKFLTPEEIVAHKTEDPWTMGAGGYVHKKRGYLIEVTRVDTKEKLLHWVYHLSEKSWLNREDLYFLIRKWLKRIFRRRPKMVLYSWVDTSKGRVVFEHKLDA